MDAHHLQGAVGITVRSSLECGHFRWNTWCNVHCQIKIRRAKIKGGMVSLPPKDKEAVQLCDAQSQGTMWRDGVTRSIRLLGRKIGRRRLFLNLSLSLFTLTSIDDSYVFP